MSENIEIRCTWRAVGLNGHREVFGSEFLYTSEDAPVEADEYVRVWQRADALLAERDTAIARAEAAEAQSDIAYGEATRANARENDAIKRAEAAEAEVMELRLALGATVERANRLAIWADRFGADQWRRGNAGNDPQEFDEWQKETQP